MPILRTFVAAAFIASSMAAPVLAQFDATHALELDGARAIVDAARAEADANGWTVAIAVVDAAGDLIYFERMDGVQPASVSIAIEKARTSARFLRPTKAFEDGIAQGRTALMSLDIVPFEGGLPIIHEGRVVAAIGVSGVTPEQDGIIAQAGINALP